MNQQLITAFRRSKMTAYRLAKDTGLSQATIHRWLKGESSISVENFERIAKALKVKIKLGK